MRSLGFFIGVAVGWLGARLVGDQRWVGQQQEMERTLDICRQSLADRTAEVERLRAELERLQAELAALNAMPPVAEKTASVPLAPPDDLTIIEGIGPKIAALLVEHGICTFADLASAGPTRLREILDAGGPRFRMANPGTWPRQAELARRRAWSDLTELQSRLKAGTES